MKITAPMMRVLQKAFAQDVARARRGGPMADMPLQVGNSKAVRLCVEFDLLKPRDAQIWPFKIAGHELTHAGRYAYCSTCTEDEQ